MREIKFRAWNLRVAPPTMMYWGKDFFDLHLKHDSMRIKCSPGNKYFEVHVLTNEMFRNSMPSCQGEVILMQYTGLKDKNGKEIYEGDILEYDGEKVKCDKCGHKQLYYSSHKLYVIKWDEEMCSFECENEENSMSSRIWGRDMKVVGNVHENPELIKSK